MPELSSNKLAASAYRTLGLPASATQAQIDSAARRLRIWADPNTVPPTPWDSPWLGPVRRAKNDIEQAVSALNEPATRVEERLLWFHRPDPALWAAEEPRGLDPTLRMLAAAKDPASVHDFAITRLQLSLLLDPQFTDSERWGRLMNRLTALAASDDYLAHLLDLEDQGEFEKRAQIEEISAALKSLPRKIADAMTAQAEAALENDDFSAASGILTTLRSMSGVEAGNSGGEERILDRLEDVLTRRCEELHHALDRIGSKTITRDQGRAMCGGQSKYCDESIEPVLAQLQSIAAQDEGRLIRARAAAARAMAHLGQCWAMVLQFNFAEKRLAAALELARGTALERPIRENLDRCRLAIRRKTNPNAGAAPPVRQGQPFVPTYAPRRIRLFGNSGGSGGWRGAGISIAVLVALLRGVFVGTSSTNSTIPLENWQRPISTPNYIARGPTPKLIVNGSPNEYNAGNMSQVPKMTGDDDYSATADESASNDNTPQYATVGKTFKVRLSTAEDRGAVAYALMSGPADFHLDPSTGDGEWVPQENQVGPVSCKFALTRDGRTTLVQFDFHCYPANALSINAPSPRLVQPPPTMPPLVIPLPRLPDHPMQR